MKRPTVVTVFAILNLVFGGLGLLCMPISVLGTLMTNDPKNPVSEILRENPAFRSWMMASLVLQVVSAIMLLTAGFGLLKMKLWGRKLSIAYGIYAIVLAAVGTAMNAVYLFVPLMEKAQKGGGPEETIAMSGAIGGMAGGCFAFVYPILLLIFMTRPKVTQAFNPIVAPQPPSMPPPMQ